MTRRMPLANVQAQLPSLIEEIRSGGESVEIVDEGVIVARLVGGTEPGKREEFLPWDQVMAGIPGDVLDAFEAALAEIHAAPSEPPIEFDE